MIIVSQCKTLIINFANVTRIKVKNYNSEFYVVCDFPNGAYEDLGIYETKERAKEVLRDIIDKYKGIEGFKVCANKVSDKAAEIAIEKGFVYEMPLE